MDYTIKQFSNQLRSLVVYDADSLSASIVILVKIGSRYEDKELNGIAHFVEHTIFKGTKKRPSPKQISMEVELLGGVMNAFTSKEYTGYYIKVPKEKFKKAIEILSDMFKNSLFKSTEVEKERGVILEEKRMYEDRPMDKVWDIFARHMFKTNNLGRTIVGEEETIKSIKQKDLLKFTSKYYNSANTVVVVAGNIPKKQAFEYIQKYFFDVKKGSKSRIKKFKKYNLNRKFHNLYKPIAQSHMALGGFALPRDHEDRFILTVANIILGGGFSSKLFKKIRDDLGLAYYVYSSLQTFQEVGIFSVGMGVRNDEIQKAVEAVLNEIRAIALGKFSLRELERAKNYFIGTLTTGLETSEELASWFGMQLLLHKKILSINEYKKEIAKVTKDDIVRVTSKIFTNDNLLVTTVTPHKKLNLDLHFK